MDKQETTLFTVDKDNNCRIGLPPAAPGDIYNKRAILLGKLENASHVLFNSKGRMFVVRGDDLYKGPTPSSAWSDWFSLATCVGRGSWGQFKFLYFDPAGDLFAVTNAGAWYKGPEPENQHVPWLYRQASKIGGSGWELFEALFFNPENIMYGVYENNLRRGHALSTTDGRWLQNSLSLGDGWSVLSYFMGFSYDGNLWCVSRDDGIMYTAPPPQPGTGSWIQRARNMGGDYRIYKHLSFTQDKTIQKILSVDFLVDIGEILSTTPELVTEKSYDNKNSTSPLNSTFEVNKTYIIESQFTHDHGFEMAIGAQTTFEAGIPFVSKGSISLSVSASTSHKWSFTEINRTETQFKLSFTFEVEPGKAVRQMAVVKKSKINVPYSAKCLTVFGYETTICGMWLGASFYDLKVKQEDE